MHHSDCVLLFSMARSRRETAALWMLWKRRPRHPRPCVGCSPPLPAQCSTRRHFTHHRRDSQAAWGRQDPRVVRICDAQGSYLSKLSSLNSTRFYCQRFCHSLSLSPAKPPFPC